MKSAGIVGAGISGLSCARRLAEAGWKVTVLEKSRSLGGRCATRSWNGNIVDHGAQFFTARTAEFRGALKRVLGDDLRSIQSPLLDQTGACIAASSPRFYHANGNNRLGKALLGSLPVLLETSAGAPEPCKQDGWNVCGHSFDAIIYSNPWPQSAPLLGLAFLQDCFVPCLTAFFSYVGEWAGNSRSCYARAFGNQALAWSACENHKTGRIQPGQTLFVVQSGPDFSQHWIEQEPAEWAERLRDLLEAAWELPQKARLAYFTHRWRYARCVTPTPEPELPAGIYVTGDSFGVSRIEDAWHSGRATAAAVLARA